MWMMTQTWQDVLFLHWPIDPQELEKHVPKELKLDLFEQNAWLSAVLLKFIDIDYAFYHLFLG